MKSLLTNGGLLLHLPSVNDTFAVDNLLLHHERRERARQPGKAAKVPQRCGPEMGN
jgi:hypothetical protein